MGTQLKVHDHHIEFESINLVPVNNLQAKLLCNNMK